MPAPTHKYAECIRCGYLLPDDFTARCTECGLDAPISPRLSVASQRGFATLRGEDLAKAAFVAVAFAFLVIGSFAALGVPLSGVALTLPAAIAGFVGARSTAASLNDAHRRGIWPGSLIIALKPHFKIAGWASLHLSLLLAIGILALPFSGQFTSTGSRFLCAFVMATGAFAVVFAIAGLAAACFLIPLSRRALPLVVSILLLASLVLACT